MMFFPFEMNILKKQIILLLKFLKYILKNTNLVLLKKKKKKERKIMIKSESLCIEFLRWHILLHLCPGLVELLYFVYSRNQKIYC